MYVLHLANSVKQSNTIQKILIPSKWPNPNLLFPILFSISFPIFLHKTLGCYDMVSEQFSNDLLLPAHPITQTQFSVSFLPVLLSVSPMMKLYYSYHFYRYFSNVWSHHDHLRHFKMNKISKLFLIIKITKISLQSHNVKTILLTT